MSHIYRKYQEKDLEQCVKIVGDVWNFDLPFPEKKLSQYVKTAFTAISLKFSNYAFVIEENGVIKGFIFCKLEDKKLPKNYISWFKLGRYLLFTSVSFFEKLKLLKLFLQHEHSSKQAENHRNNQVNLFAVSSSSQGKGYGKILMQNFLNLCKEKNISRVVLDTDTNCNYGFYEHTGFTRKATFDSPLKNFFTKSATSENFVYEIKV